MVEEAPGFPLLADQGRIQAAHLQRPLHGFGGFQLVHLAPQGCSQGLQRTGGESLLVLLLQQPLGPLVQFPQPPWGFEWLLVIAQVVQHRPADVGHGKAAERAIPLEIERFHRPDQPHGAGGDQLLKAVGAAVVEAIGHLAHQGQVVHHHRIAPMQPALALFGFGHGHQPLAVAGAQLLCIGGGEGHGRGQPRWRLHKTNVSSASAALSPAPSPGLRNGNPPLGGSLRARSRAPTSSRWGPAGW